MTSRSRLWVALLAGSLLFGLSNTAVWSAKLRPPAGYEPLSLIRSHDMAEYSTYLVLAADPTWWTPDLNAPWTLEGGVFHPLMLVPGRIGYWLGVGPAVTFQVTFYLFCLAGMWVLLYAMDFFLPTVRQRWWSVAAMLAAVPLALMAVVIKPIRPLPDELYGLGMVEFAYNSSDGLFRGGLSNSYTNACGTIAILLALTFTAKRIATGKARYRYFAAGTMFLSALLHPFEFFVIVPASAAALLWAAKRSGAWRAPVIDCSWNVAATFAGLLPTLFLAFRYQWISDLSTVFTERMYPTSILAIYGLPCILVVYCLLLRYRAVSESDQVLLVWFLTTVTIVCLPYCPYPPHLLDGFAYVTAMLLVRLLFEHRQARSVYQARPKLVLGFASAAVALSVISLAALHVQLWRDGRSKDPGLLLNALSSTDERGVAHWLRGRVSREDLVLAPPEMAPWLTQIPVHAFASHMLRSITYSQQLQEANSFYQGEPRPAAQELLQRYGIHWVVVPAGSAAARYFGSPPAGQINGFWVFEIPGNRMKPYPGLVTLVPNMANARSLSRVVRDLFARKS